MNIFGLRWTTHLIYITVAIGGCHLAKTRLGQDHFLRSEMGRAQHLTIPVIEHSNWQQFSEIEAGFRDTQMPRNEQRDQSARQARKMVDAFVEKCALVQRRIENGDCTPESRRLAGALANDYSLLGDSLRLVFPQDSALQNRLRHCVSTKDLSQLTGWLGCQDSSKVQLLIQDLRLSASVALGLGLTVLQAQMEKMTMGINAILPMISFEECPRAGRPFQADIYLAGYANANENMSVKINGRPVPMEHGLAHYQTSDARPLNIDILVKNPLTGQTLRYSKEFARF